MTTALTNTLKVALIVGLACLFLVLIAATRRCDRQSLGVANMGIIEVKPLADGWTVRSEQIDNDLVFRSGRAAEQAAFGLADRLARVGIASEVRIYLRDGALGGRFFRSALGSINGRAIAGRDSSLALEPA